MTMIQRLKSEKSGLRVGQRAEGSDGEKMEKAQRVRENK